MFILIMKVRLYNMVRNVQKMIVSLLICVILFGVLPVKCFAVSSEKVDTDKIDDYVISQMKQTNIPGASIGIIKGDKLLYTKGYGNTDTGTKVTGQTPFEIGSVSKSFTALAIMQLTEKGLIDLDSSVQEYLPWFKAYYQNQPAVITVRQLLNQNGGVATFHDGDAKADKSIEQVVKENLNNLDLVNKPGTKFLYSNANYVILGEIVQVVSGQSYTDYIEKNIFTPLDMQHSYVSKEEAEKNGLAAGYRALFGIVVKTDLPYFKGNIPCGHIISCAEDMCKYLSIYINNGVYNGTVILSPEGIKTILTPSVETLVPMGTDATEVKYAMGWGVNFKDGKIDIIEHTGETANYHAHAIIKPDESIGVIELDNLGGFITAGQIATGVEKIAMNEPIPKSVDLGKITIIFNMIYLTITILLLIALLRLVKFRDRIKKSKCRIVFNIIFTFIINIILPFVIILGTPNALGGGTWKAIIFYSPDMSIFIIATTVVLFFTGIAKLLMIAMNCKKLN